MNNFKKKPATWIVSGSNAVGKTTYTKQHIIELLSKVGALEHSL